jgi:CRP/FNR family cyclic AMP-dependent transcriptional regulator
MAAKNREFNPEDFLSNIGEGRKIVAIRRKRTIFSQGEANDEVFYVQRGKVRLSVVSKSGKEATLGILSAGDFFGEGCLIGQPLRMATATAMTDCILLKVERKAMMRVLHEENSFSDMFVSYLLRQNIQREENLVDQLFNSSEKRLARVLILLARFGKECNVETIAPKISHETLAEMVGTTRPRVSFFMSKFRKMGFIEYNGGLQVHSSLLGFILHD